MIYAAKEGSVEVGNTVMDYVSFGTGSKILVVIPGLGDALKTVKGTSILLALYYREFVREYKLYVFSRKQNLNTGDSTRQMAADLKVAMDRLGIRSANVFGISQGGMIAQYLAIDYPECVEKLILAVTVSRQNETIQNVVSRWVTMANNEDYYSFMIDTIEKTYTHKKASKYRPFYPVLSKISKPKSFERLSIQAQACLGHNAYEELHKIECETLIIGGNDDQIVGRNSSEEMADVIPKNQLVIYDGLGHGAYEEARDFNQRMLEFLRA